MSTAPAPPRKPTPRWRARRRERWQVLALLLAGLRWHTWASTGADERLRLASQVRAMEQHLARQLAGIGAALHGVQADLPGWPADSRMALANSRLKALADAVPGLQAMHLLDRQGSVLASSQPQALGKVLDPQPTGLLLTVAAPDGSAVAATFDPGYFNGVLAAALYADDMRSSIALGDGPVLWQQPAAAGAPGSATPADAGPRLSAQRTLQPPGLGLRQPLLLAVSRERAAVFAAWRQRSAIDTLLFLLAAAAAWWVLLALQRRRDALEQQASQHHSEHAADAERLALVLRGGDLGLWDLHLPSGRASVNERWYAMLGHAVGEIDPDEAGWLALMHPDDRVRVLAALHSHTGGHSPVYEATYRLRHSSGRWLWIADQGRVVEHDAGGAPLRMVGTLMDVTDRMQAEEELRRSEQGLVRLANALPGPVVRIDREQRYLFANAVFEQWFGKTSAQIIGRTRSDVRGAAVAPRIAPQVERALAGERVVFELVITALDGPHHCIVTLVPDRAADADADADGKGRGRRQGQSEGKGQGHDHAHAHAHRESDLHSGGSSSDAAGAVRGCFIIVTDISARKRAEDALRIGEQKSRALLLALRSGVVVHAADSQVLDANPSACRTLGLTLDAMRGKTAADAAWRFIEDDHAPMPCARYPVEQVRRSGEPVNNLTFGILRPAPEPPRWVLCNAFAVPGDDGALQQIVVTIADITERKLAEEALQRSEARLRMGSRMARLGGWRLDAATRQGSLAPELAQLLDVDPACAHMLPMGDGGDDGNGGNGGNGCNGGSGGSGVDFIAPAFRAQFRQCLGAGLQHGQPFDIEVEGQTRQGRSLQLRVLGEAVRDSGGRIVALQGTVQDITEWRQAQQQLRLLEAAVARLNDVVMITLAEPLQDPGPAIVFVNDAFERLTGWHRAEVLGRSPHLLNGPQTDAAELARMNRALAARQSVRGELVTYNRQRQPRWVEAEVVPLLNDAGHSTHLVTVLRDVTERKQSELERRALELQLREAQKIESIGTLAGGIAHDFNNILAAILGNVGLARDELAAEHPAQLSLDQINRAGQRARSLVQQILTFSRRQPDPLQAQPLRPVVDETLSLLRATLPAGVRLVTMLADAPLLVRADATQLQQVLMNLCTNAWHALPGGAGRVEVGLQPIDGDASARPHPAGTDLPPGPLAHLWVQDNGSGIDAPTRQRIFDPFFTTKPVGQGTGLGLSVVHGIVRSHGGAITVDSEPGRGSRFDLYFPLAAAPPPTLPALAAAPLPLPELAAAPPPPLPALAAAPSPLPELAAPPLPPPAPVAPPPPLPAPAAAPLPPPAVAAPPPPLPALAPAPPAPPAPHSGTVAGSDAGSAGQQLLYVDDDAVMVLMVQRLLQRAGYGVEVAAHGAEALALVQAAPARFDLVISDYNMPEMSGIELARALAALRPGLPVIISSGYLAEDMRRQADALGVRALLRKEHTLDQLPALVRRVLGCD